MTQVSTSQALTTTSMTVTTGWEPGHPHCHTQVKFFRPVLLFSDDVQRLYNLLAPLGSVEISTDREILLNCEDVYKARPVGHLCLTVYDIGTSVLLRPRQAELRWCHEWNPAYSETDVIPQVQSFVERHFHRFYLLCARRWQLAAMSLAFASLALSFVADLIGKSTPLLGIFSIPGFFLGVITLVLGTVGLVLPSRSHVTLLPWTLDKFLGFLKKAAYLVLGGILAFLAGWLLGNLGRTGISVLLAMLVPAVIAEAIIVYFYRSLSKLK